MSLLINDKTTSQFLQAPFLLNDVDQRRLYIHRDNYASKSRCWSLLNKKWQESLILPVKVFSPG
jgi:hypothetical protein